MAQDCIDIDELLTIPKAAAALGIPVSTLRRAVKRGCVPSVSLFNTRRRVRIADILDAIQRARAEANDKGRDQRAEGGSNGF